jgi:hypothetical protein
VSWYEDPEQNEIYTTPDAAIIVKIYLLTAQQKLAVGTDISFDS